MTKQSSFHAEFNPNLKYLKFQIPQIERTLRLAWAAFTIKSRERGIPGNLVNKITYKNDNRIFITPFLKNISIQAQSANGKASAQPASAQPPKMQIKWPIENNDLDSTYFEDTYPVYAKMIAVLDDHVGQYLKQYEDEYDLTNLSIVVYTGYSKVLDKHFEERFILETPDLIFSQEDSPSIEASRIMTQALVSLQQQNILAKQTEEDDDWDDFD